MYVLAGNLVSVQASKISTMLHQSSIIGIVPPHTAICESPWRALVKGGQYYQCCTNQIMYFSSNITNNLIISVPYAKTARILILMSIPGQIIFIYLADYIHMSISTIGISFILSYLFVSLLQVCSWGFLI